MASYISISILNEAIRFVENGFEDSVKAMASGVFNYYFTAADDFLVAHEQNRNDNFSDFLILRIRRRSPGDRGVVVDHTVAEATKAEDPLDTSMRQLETALEQANTEFGRCWAITVQGPRFMFYEYHRSLEVNRRLIPWGPPNQPGRNTFHTRNDAATIGWMLRHMAQTNNPPAR